MKKYYLTPGPSELYFTVPDHIQQALKEDICSISHRSAAFQQIYSNTVQQLQALLDIPEHFHVVFTASATEVWERLLQNCVEKHSFHLVNGAFSKRFRQFSQQLNKKASILEIPFGEGFGKDSIQVPEEAEMIAVTHNETSTGVSFPMEYLKQLRKTYPDKLISVDAVSSIPYIAVDYDQIDSLYFSVQKGMGLPAGLGVWIFNDRCVEKADALSKKGVATGTYHTIPSLLKKAAVNQTPETPNVLNIYLLGKVCEDMLRRGIKVIRQETLYKSVLMYQMLEKHAELSPFVKEAAFRSDTVIVGQVKDGQSSKKFAEHLAGSGLVIGTGYSQYKNQHIRIANFPTHSKEVFERLVDLLA